MQGGEATQPKLLEFCEKFESNYTEELCNMDDASEVVLPILLECLTCCRCFLATNKALPDDDDITAVLAVYQSALTRDNKGPLMKLAFALEDAEYWLKQVDNFARRSAAIKELRAKLTADLAVLGDMEKHVGDANNLNHIKGMAPKLMDVTTHFVEFEERLPALMWKQIDLKFWNRLCATFEYMKAYLSSKPHNIDDWKAVVVAMTPLLKALNQIYPIGEKNSKVQKMETYFASFQAVEDKKAKCERVSAAIEKVIESHAIADESTTIVFHELTESLLVAQGGTLPRETKDKLVLVFDSILKDNAPSQAMKNDSVRKLLSTVANLIRDVESSREVVIECLEDCRHSAATRAEYINFGATASVRVTKDQLLSPPLVDTLMRIQSKLQKHANVLDPQTSEQISLQQNIGELNQILKEYSFVMIQDLNAGLQKEWDVLKVMAFGAAEGKNWLDGISELDDVDWPVICNHYSVTLAKFPLKAMQEARGKVEDLIKDINRALLYFNQAADADQERILSDARKSVCSSYVTEYSGLLMLNFVKVIDKLELRTKVMRIVRLCSDSTCTIDALPPRLQAKVKLALALK
jgi:hypothetical protein